MKKRNLLISGLLVMISLLCGCRAPQPKSGPPERAMMIPDIPPRYLVTALTITDSLQIVGAVVSDSTNAIEELWSALRSRPPLRPNGFLWEPPRPMVFLDGESNILFAARYWRFAKPADTFEIWSAVRSPEGYTLIKPHKHRIGVAVPGAEGILARCFPPRGGN
jgi:hypothetical protein